MISQHPDIAAMDAGILLRAATRLGRNIRKYREEMEISQTDLAAEVGVSRKHLNRIENGLEQPHFTVLLLIAWELKKQLPELLEGIALDFTNW